MEEIMKKLILMSLFVFFLIACGSDEDECATGETRCVKNGKAQEQCIKNKSNKNVGKRTECPSETTCSVDNNVASCKNNGNGGLISKIKGNWTDNWGATYTINSSDIILESNNDVFIFTILVVGDNFVICQNGPENSYNPDLFSKFVFTNISTNQFNCCQSFYDSPSQEYIENSEEPSDPSDLTSGCNGFSWSEVKRD